MSINSTIYSPINRHVITEIKMPQIWLDTLGQIQTQWPLATFAGGALRDLDLGRPIKDVDIFIPFDNDAQIKLDKILPVRVYEEEHNPDSSGLAVGSAHCHYVFWLNGWKFEVTQKINGISSTTDVIENFDLGICRICLIDGQIYRSPEYVRDVANKTFTIVRETGGNELSHAERIRNKKYLGWTIIPL